MIALVESSSHHPDHICCDVSHFVSDLDTSCPQHGSSMHMPSSSSCRDLAGLSRACAGFSFSLYVPALLLRALGISSSSKHRDGAFHVHMLRPCFKKLAPHTPSGHHITRHPGFLPIIATLPASPSPPHSTSHTPPQTPAPSPSP